MSEQKVGRGVNRVDGPVKVQGQARYAAEYPLANLLHAFVLTSRIAKGSILSIDDSNAVKIEGVVAVITHTNRPHMAWFNRSYKDMDSPGGDHFRPLYDGEVYFSGQPVAVVVAESAEAARYAASLLVVSYSEAAHATNFATELSRARPIKAKKTGYESPKSRGDASKAFAESDYQVVADYSTPVEHHNPMEMHASTVHWQGDGQLKIFDKTQGVQNCQTYICSVFGLDPKKVQVCSPYVGGAFGSGLRPQFQLVLATMAAIKLERSVRLVLTRQQMFSFGHRPTGLQKVKIGATAEGILTSISHHAVSETSRFEDYVDNVVTWSGITYQCPNVDLDYKVLPLDLHTPLDMRAPGAAVGMFALESAIDEMAAALKMDPFEFRSRNYAERDQAHFDRAFSTKQLSACYTKGAEKFGWAKRTLEPRSQRDGHQLIGWGMATGVWEAGTVPTKAKATWHASGCLEVSSATADMGTGTYTIMAQIAAEAFGLELDAVDVKLGDSLLSTAPIAGGSWTAASVGGAVAKACTKLQTQLFKAAKKLPSSPFKAAKFDDVAFTNGVMHLHDHSAEEKLRTILNSIGSSSLSAEGSEMPNMATKLLKSMNTHSAVFVEVRVDEDLGMIEVPRVVSAIDAGRILNPKTARSQILGGVVWGISMALHEASLLDHNLGRFMNHSFAEYHIPVMKDVGDIDVIFIEEPDYDSSSLGVKGLGEIGMVGTAAAVANAVYHATGIRVRHLPITPDRLLTSGFG